MGGKRRSHRDVYQIRRRKRSYHRVQHCHSASGEAGSFEPLFRFTKESGEYGMRLFQPTVRKCNCWFCMNSGSFGFRCLCGDCSYCSVPGGRMISRRASAYLLTSLAVIGFITFAPVITIQSSTTISRGSIAYCYFGVGSLIINGTYYPLANATRVQSVMAVSCPRSGHR